jgi:hypothetical protein
MRSKSVKEKYIRSSCVQQTATAPPSMQCTLDTSVCHKSHVSRAWQREARRCLSYAHLATAAGLDPRAARRLSIRSSARSMRAATRTRPIAPAATSEARGWRVREPAAGRLSFGATGFPCRPEGLVATFPLCFI